MDSQLKNKAVLLKEIDDLMEELWNKGLYKPEVWGTRKREFETIETFPAVPKGIAIILALASFGLGIAFHWLAGLVGVIGVLILCSARVTRLGRTGES